MSRPFAVIGLCLLTLTGCGLLPEPERRPPAASCAPDPEVLAYRALRDWLDQEQFVAAMDTEEVVIALVKIGRPERPDDLFYFGLLNQKLKTHASWVQARDAFREVSQAPGTTPEQRQLAAILMLYNQSRINWYVEYQEVKTDYANLQEKLDAAREENELLQQKIQAITDLETSISTRKEQEQ